MNKRRRKKSRRATLLSRLKQSVMNKHLVAHDELEHILKVMGENGLRAAKAGRALRTKLLILSGG